MQTLVEIPEEMADRAKREAKRRGMSLDELLRDALEQTLSGGVQAPEPVGPGSSDHPISYKMVVRDDEEISVRPNGVSEADLRRIADVPFRHTGPIIKGTNGRPLTPEMVRKAEEEAFQRWSGQG